MSDILVDSSVWIDFFRGDKPSITRLDPLLLNDRVAVSRDTSTQSFTAPLPITLPLADGTTLHDKLGGPDVQVIGGTISMTLPARGAAILAP